MYGAMLHLDDSQQVVGVTDAESCLREYPELLRKQGKPLPSIPTGGRMAYKAFACMSRDGDIQAFRAIVEAQARELGAVRHAVGLLEDKNEIERLQYSYGYFIDNRMFREMADLFADEGAWIEIGERGRYHGKENIHRFLSEVLGGGRWGMARNEVISHVQQQLLITVDDDRTACPRPCPRGNPGQFAARHANLPVCRRHLRE